MRFIAHWRLQTKLLAMAAAIAGLGAVAGAFGAYGMVHIEASAQQVSSVEMAALDRVREAQVALIDAGRSRARTMLAPNADDRQARTKAFHGHAAALKASLDAAEPAFVTEAGKQAVAETRAAYTAWMQQAERYFAVLADKPYGAPDAETVQADAATNVLNAKVNEQIAKLVERRKNGAARSLAAAHQVFEQMLAGLIATIAMAIVGGLALGWLVARAVARPLAHAVGMAEAIAGGDLSPRPHATTRDEVGQLLAAMDTMTAQLRRIVGEVREGVDAIATASAQIAQGNSDLSSRTEQQAASLQQTAASVDEMSGTLRASSDHAREASGLSAQASTAATQGGAAVSEVIGTMAEIQASSRRVANIIGTIDGIAFQTNILALNAAVEAARAGEQGRGFAVVASEVRSLAQRSAEAAREIKGLIHGSVEQIDNGSALVDRAGRTIADAVAQVQRVTTLMGELAHASHEQDQGIAQINTAVGHLDQATQQNAALVEETAAAAESLRMQATKVADAMAAFRLGS